MLRFGKTILLKLYYFIKSLFYKCIYIGEYVTDRNFGDALNFVLLSKLTNKTIIPKRFCFKSQYRNNEKLLFIGSIVRKSDNQSIIWGAGIISSKDKVQGVKSIRSVRGPLTRDLLIRQGYECPPIYGDPALLLPRFYNPIIEVKHQIGFIPHFLDKEKDIVKYIVSKNHPGLIYIDIQMPVSIFKPTIYNHYKYFIDKLCSCDVIIASCLHGLVMGDVYKKRTLWIKFGNDIGGDDIKFYDYYASMGVYEISPVLLYNRNFSIDKLYELASLKPIHKVNMDLFLAQNPYL